MPDALYEKRDFYAIFTLNRPERLNALGGQLRAEMEENVDDFNEDPNMRVGILTGAGRAFSAGMDLKEAADRANTGEGVAARQTGQVPRHVYSGSPKPFIAAINGLAVGGGLEQALDCDIRIMASNAYVGLFEPRRGIIAGYAIHHLPRIVNLSAANHVLLVGDRVEPEQALQFGIVSEVVDPPDQLMPRAIALAEQIASNAPLSVQATKAMIQAWRMAKIDDSYRLGAWLSLPVVNSEDIKEGARAFAEKRDPNWQGR
jgi:crotonobetainyl-CoA hydratase